MQQLARRTPGLAVTFDPGSRLLDPAPGIECAMRWAMGDSRRTGSCTCCPAGCACTEIREGAAMKRPLIDTQRIPEAGEAVFLAQPLPRPAAAPRRRGALRRWLRRLFAPQRMQGYA